MKITLGVRCVSIRRSEREAFLLCEAPAVLFTHDSKSNSQYKRRTLRIGDVPLRASTWRRSTRSLSYYDSKGGGGGIIIIRQRPQNPARDLLPLLVMKHVGRPTTVLFLFFSLLGESAHFGCALSCMQLPDLLIFSFSIRISGKNLLRRC